MVVRFLPGEPNKSPQAVASANWNSIQILAYCSGNNLVILTNDAIHLQTIYLPSDSFVVDINKINGKLAIGIKGKIFIYSPSLSNFYEFNFSGGKDASKLNISWSLEKEVTNDTDTSDINCLNWSDSCDSRQDEVHSNQFFGLPDEYNTETSCELVVGTQKALTLWRFFYKENEGKKAIHKRLLWFCKQPNPVYIVQFSPHSNSIASVGYYDKLVKIWHRVSFGIETSEFDLSYLHHSSYVTNIRWRAKDPAANGSVSVTADPSFTDLSSLTTRDIDLASIATSSNYTKDHNVLYTLSSDSYINSYVFSYVDRAFKGTYVGSLDLWDGLPMEKRSGKKFALILDNSYVDSGLRKLLDSIDNDEVNHFDTSDGVSDLNRKRSSSLQSQDHKKEDLIMRSLDLKPEICLIMDEKCNVELYAIVNVHSLNPVPLQFIKLNRSWIDGASTKVNISLGKNCLPSDCKSVFFHEFLLSSTQEEGSHLSFLIHDLFKNSIRQVSFSFEELLELEPEGAVIDRVISNSLPSSQSNSSIENETRLPVVTIGELRNKFTGHNKSIRRLIHSLDGSAFLSLTRFCECSLWSTIPLPKNQVTLNKMSSIITPSPVKNAIIWKDGNYVITLVEGEIICFDCRLKSQDNKTITKRAPECGRTELTCTDDPLSFLLLPESEGNKCHIVAVYSNKKSQGWSLSLNENEGSISFEECEIGEVPDYDQPALYKISAIDPVGWISSFGIGEERNILATISEDGLVKVYGVKIFNETKLAWEQKYSFATGIRNSKFIIGSSINKLAIVGEDRKSLTIWDMKYSTLEFSEESEKPITDLDWTCTDYKQSILAVGFTTHVTLYTQLRFDYTNDSPTFRPIKKIDISSQTSHEIGDSIWMGDGILVIGAGNQFYVSDKELNPLEDRLTSIAVGTTKLLQNDIFYLCSALNGPLPFYHPQFIVQCLFLGRFKFVESILVKLCLKLREYDLSNEEKPLEANLGLEDHLLLRRDSILEDNSSKENIHAIFQEQSDNPNKLTSQTVGIILEKLEKHQLPYLTGHQQITLRSTIEIVNEMSTKFSQVLDKSALKFFVGIKLFQLNITKKIHTNQTVTRRDISFAFHSESKDVLLNIIKEQSGMRLTWKACKMFGLPFWLGIESLKEEIEKIARNEFFLFSEENNGAKDPSNCAIFYLALKKKTVLLGLWRTSTSTERAKMVKFLSNNFEEKRWRTAALKNGFVLLSKHRYMDAACFFLLADSLKDCVNVLIKQVNDVDLAITVARCYEGCNDGPVLRSIFVSQILPVALERSDRWTISWVFWMLNEKQLSIHSLIMPITEIISNIQELEPSFSVSVEEQVSKMINEDPVTLVMYGELRLKNPKMFEAVTDFVSQYEFYASLRAVSMYERMGCDFLSLYIMKNWSFSKTNTQKDKEPKQKEDKEVNIAKISPHLDAVEQNLQKRVAPPVSAFAEPDMSAFDFGF